MGRFASKICPLVAELPAATTSSPVDKIPTRIRRETGNWAVPDAAS